MRALPEFGIYMKKELSSIEIHCLVKEFKLLKGMHVDKIYQLEPNHVIISLNSPEGKRFLHFILPFVFFTDKRQEMPEKPSNFSLVLRKYLDNAKIIEINQLNFERIIEFSFLRTELYYLIVELFSGGNIILCDKDKKIIHALEMRSWKDRSTKRGEPYKLPPSKANIFNASFEKLEIVENISKTLATGGFGKVYAEELCLRTNILKNQKNLLKDQAKKLTLELNKLLNEPIGARSIYEDEFLVDIVPFDLLIYKSKKQKKYSSYNLSISENIFQLHKSDKEIERNKAYEQKFNKIKKIVEIQEQNLKELEKAEKECHEKGKFIYEKYVEIKEILKRIELLKKTLPWKDIKFVMKLKKVNEATGEVIVEI